MNDMIEETEPTPNRNVRQWAMICHISAFLGFIIPFGNLLGPLIVWQMKRDLDPFIDDQGKEALNFQITVTIGVFASILLAIVVIGLFLLALIVMVAVVLMVIAGVKANEGQTYRYPFCLRFIS